MKLEKTPINYYIFKPYNIEFYFCVIDSAVLLSKHNKIWYMINFMLGTL